MPINPNDPYLKAEEVADELAEMCFEEAQKTLIEFTQGKQVCTIKDQFLNMYKGYNSWHRTPEDFYKAFAIKLQQAKPILYKLEAYLANIVKLKELDTYKDTVGNTELTVTDNEENNKSNESLVALGDSLNVSSSLTDNVARLANISKAADTETSRLYDIEDDWADVEIEAPTLKTGIDYEMALNDQRELTLKKVDSNINQIATEPNPDRQQITYNNISYTRNAQGESSRGLTTGQVGNKSKNNSTRDGTLTKTGKNTVNRTTDNKTFNSSKLILSLADKKVSDLRHQFWLSFQHLFQLTW